MSTMQHHHTSYVDKSCDYNMLVMWLFFMQQYRTSHVTHVTAVVIPSSPISMPHHHVSIKPQGCINAELWVGPAEERGEPPTLPRVHEEKDSIVTRHQPLQRLHVWSNLLYGLGYTRKSEEVGSNWPLGNQPPQSQVEIKDYSVSRISIVLPRLKHHTTELPLRAGSLALCKCVNTITVFLRSATIFFLLFAVHFGWLLLNGSYYSRMVFISFRRRQIATTAEQGTRRQYSQAW